MEIFLGHIDGNQVSLPEEESAHCVRVLRHREGDEIPVIDGEGTLYTCRLTDASPKAAQAVVVSKKDHFGEHPYHLTMAVCPTKNIDRFEWFVEKATEIGIDCFAPVFGDRSERKILKTDRIRRIVLSATKQSLKGRIPEVQEPVSVREFIENAAEGDLKMVCYCLDEESQRKSINEVLAQNPGRNISILIGPEGDFSPEEISLAFSHGWLPVHLGDSRLRTETAATMSVAAVYLDSMK